MTGFDALQAKREARAMAISLLDQMLFSLPCGHNVVLGRVQGAESGPVRRAVSTTDLTGAVRAALVQDFDTADRSTFKRRSAAKKLSGSASHDA